MSEKNNTIKTEKNQYHHLKKRIELKSNLW